MRGKNKTFADMAERYLKEVTPDKKPNSQRDDKFYARTICKFFGKFYLNEITADLITQYLLKRKKKVGPSSINRELAFLSASFNKAYKLWGWCRENPVSKIKREKEKKRVKYFSDEEFSRIFSLLADWVKPIVLLAKNTGLRLSNLANLRWVEVHLKNKIIILDGEVMKNAETLGMPLNQVAVEVIAPSLRKENFITNLYSVIRMEILLLTGGFLRPLRKPVLRLDTLSFVFTT